MTSASLGVERDRACSRIWSGTPILPMSWRVAPSRSFSSCSTGRPISLAEQHRVGDDALEVPAGVRVAPLDRLGERGHRLDEGALLLGVEPRVVERRGERPGEEPHAAQVVCRRSASLPTRVEQLQHADHPAARDERHGQDRVGVEVVGVRRRSSADRAVDVVDHLGLAAERDARPRCPRPSGTRTLRRSRARRCRARRGRRAPRVCLVELPDRARLGGGRAPRPSRARLEHAPQVERRGELEADLEQRLLLGSRRSVSADAVQHSRRPSPDPASLTEGARARRGAVSIGAPIQKEAARSRRSSYPERSELKPSSAALSLKSQRWAKSQLSSRPTN